MWLLVTLVLISVYQSQGQTPIWYTLEEESTSVIPLGNIIQDGGLQLLQDNSIFFTILPVDQDLHLLFEVDKNGDFKRSRRVNRDAICPQAVVCEIQLDIQVNPEIFFEIVKVVVMVTDINDEVPSFAEKIYTIQISEAAESSISLPRALDLDSPENGLVSYREADLDTSKFELSTGSSNEPVLIIKESLDREESPKYQFILLAVDSQTPDRSASTTVIIDLLDINDNFPQFTKELYEVSTYEQVKANQSLVQVSASDKDSGENSLVFYYFSSVTLETYGAVFNIDEESGDVRTNGELDYETIKEALLTVIARNREPTSPFSQARVSVRVMDINDESPSIRVNKEPPGGGVFTVLENASLSTFVAHITVSDPDTGDGGLFTCTLDKEDFALVKMYETEFKIVTNVLFDREAMSKYDTSVTCTDKGDPALSSTQDLVIQLTDINDNSPICKPDTYVAEVVENQGVGDVLLTIVASDEDTDDNGRLTFDLSSGQASVTARKHLEVNSQTGDITLIEPFDYEKIKMFSFNITVSDHGHPNLTSECSVIIKVSDIDDEYPLFDEVVYEMKIPEDNALGASVGNVTAKDLDSDAFNSFTYGFVGLTDEGLDSNTLSLAEGSFIIDSKTGEITVNSSLDRETRDNYSLHVMAKGESPNHLKSSCRVEVIVTDINDNSPVMIFPSSDNNTVYVTRVLQLDSSIARVIAIDDDSNENSRLNYHIVSGDENGILAMDSTTGEITCSKYYTAPVDHLIQVLIHVTDSGHPQLSNSTFLVIDFSLDTDDPLPLLEEATSSKNAHILIIIAVLSGVLTVILATAIFCLLRQRRRGNKPKHTKIQTISQDVPTVYTAALPPGTAHRGLVALPPPGTAHSRGLTAEFDEVTFQQAETKQHTDSVSTQPHQTTDDPDGVNPHNRSVLSTQKTGADGDSEASDSGHGSNEESSSLPGTTTLRRWENRLLTAAVTRQESNRLQSSQSFRSDSTSTTPPALPPRRARRTSQSFQFRFPPDSYIPPPPHSDYLPSADDTHSLGDELYTRTEYTPSGLEGLDYMYDHPTKYYHHPPLPPAHPHPYPSGIPPPPYPSDTHLVQPPPVFQFPEDEDAFHREEFVDFMNIPGYNPYSDDLQEGPYPGEQRIYSPDEVFGKDLLLYGGPPAENTVPETQQQNKNNSKYCSQV